MVLYQNRLFRNDHETISILSLDNKILCWILEDEKRAKKVYGETRIPKGMYELMLRKYGGHHESYSRKFPEMHKGMIQLKSVPNFQDILIHIGNTDKDTAGCLLTGTMAVISRNNRYTIINSTTAYKYIYPLIADPLNDGMQVLYTINDELTNDVYNG